MLWTNIRYARGMPIQRVSEFFWVSQLHEGHINTNTNAKHRQVQIQIKIIQRATIASGGDITESNPFKSGQLASKGNTLQPIVVQINCLSIFAVWRKN